MSFSQKKIRDECFIMVLAFYPDISNLREV